MKNKKIMVVVGFFIFSLIISVGSVKNLPIEQLYPIVGVGYDVEDDLQYSAPLTVYRYKGENEIKKANIKGVEKTIGETREERQLKMDKSFKLGSERVLVISSKQASLGIKPILNILFANSEMNDRALVVVCKGKSIDILNYKVKGYLSSAEYIEGMIKNASMFNFSSSEYKLLDAYVKVESEGQNLILPYMELDDKGLNYSGMAVFKKDKMAYVLDSNKSKVLNMLREKKGSGVLTIQESGDKYLNYIANVNKKVKCNKKNDTYEFSIDLNFIGDIWVNTLYAKIDKEKEKEIEDEIKANIENICNEFIKEMKTNIKIDCLDLGMYGVAKYGRDTGVDWNEIVCNSEIKVNVKVKVDKSGRGEY